MRRIPLKGLIFWPLLMAVFLADGVSKHLAQERLSPAGTTHEILGDAVRFALAYNDNAALGINAGRTGFRVLVVVSVALVIGMGIFYRKLPPSATAEAVGLGLVTGGALGNLMDRVMSPRGVVDFIDVGIGTLRFWTFNVADAAITVGALVLAWCLWRRPKEPIQPPSHP